MPRSDKPNSELGLGSLSNRFRDSLSCDASKPDSQEVDHGSPISTLRPRQHGSATLPATSSSSSSGSSGSVSSRTSLNPASKKSNSGKHSGSSDNKSPTAAAGNFPRKSKSGSSSSQPTGKSHRSRSSSSSAANSPQPEIIPAGNICPSGGVPKFREPSSSRTDVLGSGTGNYGHGSIMWRGGRGDGLAKARASASESMKRGMRSVDPDEVKRAGNEQYKLGHFAEALTLYDRAIELSPGNAIYWSNRAAALTGLERLEVAVGDCEEAVRLDPNYERARNRLATLFLRLGQVENAKKHLCYPGLQPDPSEVQKLQIVEKHISKCVNMRRIGEWKSVIREVDAAIATGVDFSAQLSMCRTEALLKLHQMDDAESSFVRIPTWESRTISMSQAKFFGMLSEAYCYFVRAELDMAFGRFENAVRAAEKASQIDKKSVEVAVLLSNVRMVARAQVRGNDLFKSERFTEAGTAYGEGLRLDPSNSVLYCDRAACWFKIGQWEKAIEDSNHALGIQPNYKKALLQRAASNSKLERWEEAVKDYEVLRRELPDDKEVAEALFHAHLALKKIRGEEVQNLKFGGEVEAISDLQQFRAAIALPGVSVVHFETASNLQCKQISPFVDTLCSRYPSTNFLRVDIQENPTVATSENVRIVPTFKIYKNGSRVKEIVCPSRDMLDHSIKHYSI
ncbi:unnamed protein product [Lupinus luteus]|uniref:Thioredoxin domain-containing protein n=1 Tax=Lupinus luteus TaxID=3873 RepID=A0AAV1YI47_LUPLU